MLRRWAVPILFVCALAFWAAFLRPVAWGGRASMVMVTGQSMEPTFWTGDLVIALRSDTYAVGEVIAYHAPVGDDPDGAPLVIHRVVEHGADGFVTLGDNNPAQDPWTVPDELVVGRAWLHVPGAGRWLGWLRQPLHLAALFGGLTAFWIVSRDPDAADGVDDDWDNVDDPAPPARRRDLSGVAPTVITVLAIAGISVALSVAPGSASHLIVDGGTLQTSAVAEATVPIVSELTSGCAVTGSGTDGPDDALAGVTCDGDSDGDELEQQVEQVASAGGAAATGSG